MFKFIIEGSDDGKVWTKIGSCALMDPGTVHPPIPARKYVRGTVYDTLAGTKVRSHDVGGEGAVVVSFLIDTDGRGQAVLGWVSKPSRTVEFDREEPRPFSEWYEENGHRWKLILGNRFPTADTLCVYCHLSYGAVGDSASTCYPYRATQENSDNPNWVGITRDVGEAMEADGGWIYRRLQKIIDGAWTDLQKHDVHGRQIMVCPKCGEEWKRPAFARCAECGAMTGGKEQCSTCGEPLCGLCDLRSEGVCSSCRSRYGAEGL